MTGSASPSGNRYLVERAVFPRDKDRAISLWRGNLGDANRVEGKFEWFYERSPTGEPLALLLYFADTAGERESVGIAAAGMRSFLLGDQPVEAGVLVDMTVCPRHRTLFPALTLQKGMLQAGLAVRPLLYGFPNYKAAPVFQRVGYRKLGAMTRFVRVLRAADYLAGRVPKWLAAAVGPVIDVLAAVRFSGWRRGGVRLQWRTTGDAAAFGDIERTAGKPLLRGVRTVEFLQWRFTADRGRLFSLVNVHERDADASLGYWIVHAADGVLVIHDCAAGLLASPFARSAWNALFAEARQRGFRSVSFECLAPAEFVAVLRQVGMLPRTERPVFAALREGSAFSMSADSTYLTAADEDE
jgi:hypothetical protein